MYLIVVSEFDVYRGKLSGQTKFHTRMNGGGGGGPPVMKVYEAY